MKLKKILILILLSACQINSTPYLRAPSSEHVDVSEEMRQFLTWEAEHNKVEINHPQYGSRPATFTQQVYDLPHVDIEITAPSDLYTISDHENWMRGPDGQKGPHALIIDRSENLPPDLRQYFFIEDGDKKFVRYYFHPLDTHFRPQALAYFDQHTIPYNEGTQLKAYSTASRSLIAFDPENGRSFSLKTSTNTTSQGAGVGELRPLPTRFAHAVRRLSDAMNESSGHLRHLDVAYEPLSVGFPQIDQAMSLRLMEKVSNGEVTQMSGFVFNDTEEAQRLALRAGRTFDEFWEEAFLIKGRGMAELALELGFWSLSNHAQNFRWELTPEGQLTGRVIYLDISDGKPIKEILEARGHNRLLQEWVLNTDRVNSPLERGVNFSNFYRGDFGSVPQKYHDLIARGIAQRSAEILGVSENQILTAMIPEYWNGNQNLRMGWKLNTNAPGIAEAYTRHLATLRESASRQKSCAQMLTQLASP
jgi:hypothetical protein